MSLELRQMHYLSLDTNTWIYMANGTEPVKLLAYIRQEVYKGNIQILLPEIIPVEWKKNKDKAVKQGGLKHFKDVQDALNRLQKLLGGKDKNDALSFLLDEESDKNSFLDFAENFKTKKSEVEEAIAKNIKLIEDLFQHQSTQVIKITDTVKLKAGEYALEKKAPFGFKNSFADALILFSFIEFVKENAIEGALFVSYNDEDFCEKQDKIRRLHPDLKGDFADTKSQFHRYVGEALKTIEDEILSAEELERIKEIQEEAKREQEMSYCEVCNEMHDRYNEVYFGHPVELMDEWTVSNPNQLNLDFDEPTTRSKPHVPYENIEVGFCSWCNSQHFICVGCGSLNAVWEGEYNKKKECSNCSLSYRIERSSDTDEVEEFTYTLLNDTETCAKCGEEFERNDEGTSICPKCEDEYSYGVK